MGKGAAVTPEPNEVSARHAPRGYHGVTGVDISPQKKGSIK